MLEGYCEENSLPPGWLKLIPMIFKRREIVLYVAVHRGLDLDSENFARKYLNGRREAIENKIPYLDIEFAGLA